ncbi:hypothetical protein MFUR16E_13175 [Methylobacterium fujisawaense]
MGDIMRAWLVAGVAFSTLVGSIDTVEARGRGRLFFGRSSTAQRPASPPSVAATDTAPSGRAGYRPIIAIAPAPIAAAVPAAAAAAVANTPAEAREPELRPQPTLLRPPPETPRVQAVRAVAPSCETGRRVGGVDRAEAGFCLIN